MAELLAESDSKPKHALLAEALDREIRQLPPGTPIMAVTSLMDRFQVSQGTVVHAIRHLRSKGLVTRPPGKKRLVVAGRKMKSESVLNILLLRPSWSSPDYDTMIYALMEEATRQRLHLETVHYGPAWREDIASAVKSHDALVMLPSASETPHLFSLIEESRLPSVMLWEEPRVRGMMRVGDDNLAVGRMAANYLLGLGHKNVIAFLSEPPTSRMRDRLEGWKAALLEAGVRHPERMVIDCTVEPGMDGIVGSYEKLRRWLYQNDNKLPGTAVFCLCWTGALGMLRALREVGISVPQDVAILSHGGENRLCEFTNPALSVVQGNVTDTAREALDLLKDACIGNPIPKTTVLLPPTIIERESTSRFPTSGSE
jgi:DNA-binding LacI/PurR family transcriptional regulator